MDQTSIKTLYIFVEIAIDSSHLIQTIRLNFPTDRRRFHEALLESEETDSRIPAGRPLTRGNHLRIEGPSLADSPDTDGKDTQAELTVASYEPTKLALVSTIQFVAALSRLKDDLSTEYPDTETSIPVTIEGTAGQGGDDLAVGRPKLWTGRYDATIPRSKPLSPGEILGCTAPTLNDVDALMYVQCTSLIASATHSALLLAIWAMAGSTWNPS